MVHRSLALTDSKNARMVAICIATAGRPDEIVRLLESLASVRVPSGTEVRIIIVDNGPLQEIYEAQQLVVRLKFPTLVLSETRPGIPFARNALVNSALETDADLVVFLDDDEVVGPGWLDHLFRAFLAHRADVVAGPVVPSFPRNAPSWAVKSGVYERTRYPTGTRLEWAATGNTLVSREVFERVKPWFQPRLARSGGSDFEFFQRAAEAGAVIVWCDEAVAHEYVPADRATLKWFLRRTLRTGSVRGAEYRRSEHQGAGWHMSMRAVRAAAVVLAASSLAVLELPRGWLALRRVRQALFHLGVLIGLTGRIVEEYGFTANAASECPEP